MLVGMKIGRLQGRLVVCFYLGLRKAENLFDR